MTPCRHPAPAPLGSRRSIAAVPPPRRVRRRYRKAATATASSITRTMRTIIPTDTARRLRRGLSYPSGPLDGPESAPGCRDLGLVLAVAQHGARGLDVDVLRQLRSLREDRHRRGGHREETAVHGRDDPIAVGGGDGDDTAFHELAEDRLVARHDTDLALGRLGADQPGGARPEALLDGNEVHGHFSHRGLLPGDLLGSGLDVVESTAAVERLLGQVVELTLGDAVERLDGVTQRHHGAGLAGELLSDDEVLAEELLDTTGAADEDLVLLGELVHAEDGDDVLQLLVLLQDPLDLVGDPEVLGTDDAGLEDARGRRQRVHGGVDTHLRDRTRELGGRIEVRERRGRRRVGVVVGGHVDRLQRGDRTTTGRGDALLELTHLVRERRLVTHGRRHAAEQRRDLGAGLREAEDVVDEQQHVLALDIAEVLRHGQRGQGDAHTRSRRLVHLAEDEGGVLEDAHLLHLEVEVGALTGALADAGEHRRAGELTRDTGDHLLDQNGLADAGTTEQTDLAALDVRGQQVDDLDAGLEDLGLALELVEGRRLAVDAPLLAVASGARGVQAVTEGVEHVALDDVADRHRDRAARVDDRGAAHQAVGGLHGDRAHQVVTQVLRDLEGQGLRHGRQSDLCVQGVEQIGNGTTRELDVHDGPDDPNDAAGSGRGRPRPVVIGCCCGHVLSHFLHSRRARWHRRRSR
ncbi:Cellobiose phosphorylase (modular protein) [Rhodococcus ruber]|uniref:Cellobiose phosphorylase (Modular protein) n=1 Tax=Rhodococcus ruber TaxID=1830 RepID=A0A098BVE2_9NOCA|nr:Cellobiose phosphorylase (modular protein) [Rhodococcus ruber]